MDWVSLFWLARRALLVVGLLAAVVGVTIRPSAAAAPSISAAKYTSTQICSGGVCTKSPVPEPYLQVLGSGFTTAGPVVVTVRRAISGELERSYATVFQGGKLSVKTDVPYCPGTWSPADLLVVQAVDVLSGAESNELLVSQCPGRSL